MSHFVPPTAVQSVRRYPEGVQYYDTAHYLRTIELGSRPNPTYIADKQKDVSAHMRAILVDWMNEVTQEFRLKSETFCMSVSLCDRYLSRATVPRAQLQLVGVACLLIASKYEEIVPPTLNDFVYITDNTYSRNDLARMELHILQVLEFRLTVPTVRDYLVMFLRAGSATDPASALTDFLLELMQQEYEMLSYPPSMIAAAAVVVSLYALRLPYWTEALRVCTQYEPEELECCVTAVIATYHAAMNTHLKAVREKYSHSKYMHISVKVVLPIAPPPLGAGPGSAPLVPQSYAPAVAVPHHNQGNGYTQPHYHQPHKQQPPLQQGYASAVPGASAQPTSQGGGADGSNGGNGGGAQAPGQKYGFVGGLSSAHQQPLVSASTRP